MSLYSTFESERSLTTHEKEQQDLVDKEIETEIKTFLPEKKLSADEVKEAEVLFCWNLNKKKIHTSC